MPNQKTMIQIELAELILSVDGTRAADDPFKLPSAQRLLLENRLTDLKIKDDSALTMEGNRAEASASVRSALEKLRQHLRDGFNFIKGIGSYTISDAERLGVFTQYGWNHGEIGLLPDDRVETLANRAIIATQNISNTAWQYPAPLLALISAQLAILNTNLSVAQIGRRQVAIAARDAALDLLEKVNNRIRFFYCYSSDDVDQTPELARIGRQPRRQRESNNRMENETDSMDNGGTPVGLTPGNAGMGTNGLASPGAPVLTANGLDAVNVQWVAVPGATLYQVYRQIVGVDANFVSVGTVSGTSTSVDALQPGSTVRIQVSSWNSQGESAPGAYSEITLPTLAT